MPCLEARARRHSGSSVPGCQIEPSAERTLAAQLAAELLLDCPDLAESIAQVPASGSAQILRIEMVIWVDPPLDLPDLVHKADALEELERLAQRAGKVALESARRAGGAEAFRCRAEA